MTAPDPIMARIATAMELPDPQQRADALTALWTEVGADGDPLHVVTIAHYLADLQEDPRDELEWDQRALVAASRLTDDRAQRHHASLQVRGFLPSLHLNLAADHAKLGDPAAARAHLASAEADLHLLVDDGYGRMIRGGIARLRAELGG